MPARYATVDWEPWTAMGMRKMPVDNYLVFYLVDAQEYTVNIVRIFYGGRDIESIVRGEE
jgi:toxin ParE1/3/4